MANCAASVCKTNGTEINSNDLVFYLFSYFNGGRGWGWGGGGVGG